MAQLPIVPDDIAAREAAADPARPDLRDEDLEPLLTRFYATVERDELLAPYFAPIDMAEHIPRIADFW